MRWNIIEWSGIELSEPSRSHATSSATLQDARSHPSPWGRSRAGRGGVPGLSPCRRCGRRSSAASSRSNTRDFGTPFSSPRPKSSNHPECRRGHIIFASRDLHMANLSTSAYVRMYVRTYVRVPMIIDHKTISVCVAHTLRTHTHDT